MLENLHLFLCRTKYPENIGSAARACANMGCPNLNLVSPQIIDMDKIMPLATVKAKEIVQKMQVFSSLSDTLKDMQVTYCTTARIGGWRKGEITAEKAGGLIASQLSQGLQVGLVFGPEDKGLNNQEINQSGQIVCIPTLSQAWSLNLAQAILILLYERFKQSQSPGKRQIQTFSSKAVSHAEREALYQNIQESLLQIDFLKPDNPDYFMLPLKRFLQRFQLRKSEYNLLMGICRQIKWFSSKQDK